MSYTRFDKLIQQLRGTVVDFGEYRKARLIYHRLDHTYGEVTPKDFELFMDKADLLEASIYEELRIKYKPKARCAEAWFQAETFRRVKKALMELPAFSTG